MAKILQHPTPIPATNGISPNRKSMVTEDGIATITAAGYMNTDALQNYPLSVNDILDVFYNVTNYGLPTQSQSYGLFTVGISNGVITLTEDSTTSGVSYTSPSVANHIAVFTNTSGNISQDVATAINSGNIQAGLSGTAGTLTSYPSTAASGALKLAAVVNSGGNFNTTISNAASVGQAQVISIPDSGAATANFLLSATSTSSQTLSTGLSLVGGGTNIQITGGGNFLAGSSGAAGAFYSYPATALSGRFGIAGVADAGNHTITLSNLGAFTQDTVFSFPDVGQASVGVAVVGGATVDSNLLASNGVGSILKDAGYYLKANTTAAYAGGGTSNAFVATGLTATMIVTAVILTSTNAASIVKAVPTANTLTVEFSADPGPNTVINWIAMSQSA